MLVAQRVAADLAAVTAAGRRARGAEYLEALSHLFQRVAEHRGLAAQRGMGADVRLQLAHKQQQVRAALEGLAELDRRHGHILGTPKWIEEIRASWGRVADRVEEMSPEESFREHTQLISKILELGRWVWQATGMRQDPSPDVAFLASALAESLPRTIEAMGQLRAVGLRLLSVGAADLGQRAGIQERVGGVRLLREEVRQQLAQAAGNPAVHAALARSLQHADRLTEQNLRLAEEAVVRARPLRLPPEVYFAAATQAIDAWFEVYREGTRLLRAAVEARAERLRRQVLAVAGLLVAMLSAAAIGGVAVARTVTRPLGRLVRALERVGQGDLQVRVEAEGSDELAHMARTLEHVTARLRLAARRQELLRELAGILNGHLEVDPMLREACPLLQELLDARAVWVYVLDGPRFRLGAAAGVPQSLSREDYQELRWQPCRCQERLLHGGLEHAVNVVECLRLEKLAEEAPTAEAAREQTGGLRAHASVPIRTGSRTLGLLNFARESWDAVDETTLQLASVAAETLAVALERAQLYVQAERTRRREREATAELARRLLGVVDLGRIGEETFSVLREFLSPQGVALLVRDPSESFLEVVASWGWPTNYRSVPLQPPGGNPVAWAVAHRRLIVEDLSRPELVFEVPGPLRAMAVRTLVVLPLLADRRPTGALVFTYREHRPLKTEELEFAAAVAGVAGVAVERALEHRENRVLFEEVPVGLYRSTPSGRFLDVNRVLVRMLGYPDRDSLLNTPTTALYVDPDDRCRWQEMMHREGVVVGFETYWRRWDGEVLAVRQSARVVRDASGAPAYYEGAVEDVTARKHLEANLYLLANYDGLTGLFNRRRFQEEVERAARQAESTGGSVAVAIVDLDHFKEINERLGPAKADDTLRAVAEVLRRIAPAESCLARLGGDSFGLCVPGVGLGDARALGSHLVASLRGRTAEGEGVRMPVTASCGVAVYPYHSCSPYELMVLAEVAMYAAKAAGRDRAEVASRDPEWRDRHRVRLDELAWLREAVSRGHLMAFAQPIAHLGSGHVRQYELLVRGVREGEVLEPSRFLDLAERHGLAPELDLWVCRRAAAWVAARDDLRLHVNLSGATLADDAALQQLLDLGRQLGDRANRVVLEITERMALAELHRVTSAVEALRSRGFQVALDDFGTGVSSLYLLRHLPIDYVKVDRSFVSNVAVDVKDQSVVRSVVELCHTWGQAVIAEGVEHPDILDVVRRLGVDYVQGYHVGRPGPDEEVLRQ
ncbi:MAG: EAL domain-containing protein [Armatimonadota bacterium]|nr:EAL domain-containing protein [Armatimonadota bacterium]MDW8156443.1 EAL domain-containing protein [Armatimonadota bacterium]